MFFTIGHSTRGFDDFVDILLDAGVTAIADVRRFPGSRRHPQFDREHLASALPATGIRYRHFVDLGGRRGTADPDSPNRWWQIDAFRNYADVALTPPYRRTLQELRDFGRDQAVAVMCAEALWWQCHRRLVADNLIAAGEAVTHLLALGKREPAQLSEGARVQADGRVLYPPTVEQLAMRFE